MRQLLLILFLALSADFAGKALANKAPAYLASNTSLVNLAAQTLKGRVCPRDYNPVCARTGDGKTKTFSNKCMASGATIISQGPCPSRRPTGPKCPEGSIRAQGGLCVPTGPGTSRCEQGFLKNNRGICVPARPGTSRCEQGFFKNNRGICVPRV